MTLTNSPNAKYPHADLTGKVIKCCMEAHNFLGPGLPEITYHKAVLKELAWAAVPFQSEREVAVRYKDGEVLDVFRPDIVADAKVIVEFKALACLTEDHISQVLTYLKATNLQIGLLINFGERKLAMRRLINKYFDPMRPANLAL